VPGDVSLVGFDDIPTSDFVDPALTTVAGAKTQFGRAGIDLLMTLFQEWPQRRAARRILPTQLIVRASTATAPRQR
jgi:DNA-binding LacI/PurR family transcriptional regulator